MIGFIPGGTIVAASLPSSLINTTGDSGMVRIADVPPTDWTSVLSQMATNTTRRQPSNQGPAHGECPSQGLHKSAPSCLVSTL